MIKKAEELARRWMPGFRQGPGKREAWRHPEDLVRVFTEEMPIDVSPEEHEKRIAVAWLHDIIEDGKKESGGPVFASDLENEGIPQDVVYDVLGLTCEGSKSEYLARLTFKSARTKVVKCVDRICNLREGRESFKVKRWIRYVGETYYFIFPLAEEMPKGSVERGFLTGELIKAVEARTIGACPIFPERFILPLSGSYILAWNDF